MNSLLTRLSIPFTKHHPVESFSRATLEHAEMTLDESLHEFYEATESFGSKPSFELAVDLCLASRTAWLKVFPAWRVAGDSIGQTVQQSRDLFGKSASLLEEFRRTLSDKEKLEKVVQFTANVKWRFEMASVMADTSEDFDTRIEKIIELEIQHSRS